MLSIKNKKLLNTQTGFTLVELLLVVTLMAISLGVTSNILLSLLNSYNKTSAINEVEQQANFVALKIEKQLKNASSVSVDATGNQLTFSLGGNTIYYNVANQNIYASTSSFSTSTNDALISTPSINQTAIGVILECDGKCFALSGSSPQVVDISMIFKQSSGSSVVFAGQINVKNTIVVRNSY